ncbi:hypothetical protein HK405_010310 [Cladochytrium tenue]|nr:hypothetical protein HK405_010310 [Cladochytrium tenue]
MVSASFDATDVAVSSRSSICTSTPSLLPSSRSIPAAAVAFSGTAASTSSSEDEGAASAADYYSGSGGWVAAYAATAVAAGAGRPSPQRPASAAFPSTSSSATSSAVTRAVFLANRLPPSDISESGESDFDADAATAADAAATTAGSSPLATHAARGGGSSGNFGLPSPKAVTSSLRSQRSYDESAASTVAPDAPPRGGPPSITESKFRHASILSQSSLLSDEADVEEEDRFIMAVQSRLLELEEADRATTCSTPPVSSTTSTPTSTTTSAWSASPDIPAKASTAAGFPTLAAAALNPAAAACTPSGGFLSDFFMRTLRGASAAAAAPTQQTARSRFSTPVLSFAGAGAGAASPSTPNYRRLSRASMADAGSSSPRIHIGPPSPRTAPGTTYEPQASRTRRATEASLESVSTAVSAAARGSWSCLSSAGPSFVSPRASMNRAVQPPSPLSPTASTFPRTNPGHAGAPKEAPTETHRRLREGLHLFEMGAVEAAAATFARAVETSCGYPLGECLLHGFGQSRSTRKGVAELEAAAEGGEVLAMFELARFYRRLLAERQKRSSARSIRESSHSVRSTIGEDDDDSDTSFYPRRTVGYGTPAPSGPSRLLAVPDYHHFSAAPAHRRVSDHSDLSDADSLSAGSDVDDEVSAARAASTAGALHPRLGSEASSAADSVDAPPAAALNGLAVTLGPAAATATSLTPLKPRARQRPVSTTSASSAWTRPVTPSTGATAARSSSAYRAAMLRWFGEAAARGHHDAKVALAEVLAHDSASAPVSAAVASSALPLDTQHPARPLVHHPMHPLHNHQHHHHHHHAHNYQNYYGHTHGLHSAYPGRQPPLAASGRSSTQTGNANAATATSPPPRTPVRHNSTPVLSPASVVAVGFAVAAAGAAGTQPQQAYRPQRQNDSAVRRASQYVPARPSAFRSP